MKDRLGYTEFSFGYAFTENLIRSSATAPYGAPSFPNLVQEGKLGYDVRIDLPAFPLFFQFKLPELMVRETAAEIATHGLPLNCEFFRMALMRRNCSAQHQLLIDLEHMQPGAVFYASPMMKSVGDFDAAYNSAAAHLRSALFSPSDIGPLPDDSQHVVSYNANATSGWFCSEPAPIKLRTFETLLPQIEDRLAEPGFADVGQVVRRVRGALLEARGGEIMINEAALRERFRSRNLDQIDSELSDDERAVAEELFVARELARVGVGVELIIAQPRCPTDEKTSDE